VRGKPELFADHYAQARLFWISQTPVEQAHIVNAFRFELTRVQTVAVRRRVLAGLVNVDERLAALVAAGLGMEVPPPLPLSSDRPMYHYPPSPALSLFSRPGNIGVVTRRVALLVAPGVDGAQTRKLYAALLDAGAVPRLVGQRVGKVAVPNDAPLDIEISFETGPAVLFDGAVIPDCDDAEGRLARDASVIEFLKLQYRHGKPLLALGSAAVLLRAAGIPVKLPGGEADPGVIVAEDGEVATALARFETALAQHRVYARETDPPRV
jgi:catalase